MSDSATQNTPWLTLFGSLGAILIFVLIIYLAYLPNRPEPINVAVAEARQAKADEARAAGLAKISGYAVSSTGSIQVPIEDAMELVVEEYKD
ncbi:MAG: hypothetical protein AAF065_02660 [Verrucomicrobiota bacterium]